MNQTLTADLRDTLRAVAQTGLFVSLCTIEAPPDPNVPNATGQVDLTNYTPVSGLVDIPCMRAVMPQGDPNPANQNRGVETITQKQVYHVLLDGYFPQIGAALDADVQWRAVVDGVPYTLLTAQYDSQRVLTRLACRSYAV